MRQKLLLFLAILLPLSQAAFAQTTVKGKVVDETGEPVIGAAVFVEGAEKVGTLTDLDGNYTLPNVPEKAKNLVASCIGYKDQRKTVAAVVNFTLQEDAEVLDAAVATGMQQIGRGCFGPERIRYFRNRSEDPRPRCNVYLRFIKAPLGC